MKEIPTSFTLTKRGDHYTLDVRQGGKVKSIVKGALAATRVNLFSYAARVRGAFRHQRKTGGSAPAA